MQFKAWLKHWGLELLLAVLIAIDVLSFLGYLPLTLELFDKLVSWVVLGILFYHLSITLLIFGVQDKKRDGWILLSYFLLIMKDLLALLRDLLTHGLTFQTFFTQVVSYTALIELISFYGASLLILAASIYLTLNLPVKHEGTLTLLHEEGYVSKKLGARIKRFFLVFLLINAFYLFLFNLMVEWIGMIADDMITILSLLIVLILLFRHLQKIKASHFFAKIGGIGEEFYTHVIERVHTQRFFLVVIGILILHLITDVFVFILPLFIGNVGVSYFGYFEEQPSLLGYMGNTIVQYSAGNLSGTDTILTLLVYSLNLIGVLLLTILPIVLWYVLYTFKKENVSQVLLILFFVALIAMMMVPAFSLEGIEEQGLSGVNMLARDISSYVVSYRYELVGILTTTLIFAYFLTKHYKQFSIFISLLAFSILFTFYIFEFFLNLLVYYVDAIRLLITTGHILLAAHFFVFFVLTFLFYTLGTSYFFYSIKKEYGYFS